VIWPVLDCGYAGEAPIPAVAQIVIAAILRRILCAMPYSLDRACECELLTADARRGQNRCAFAREDFGLSRFKGSSS
jgi:hypothetical protein